MSCRSALFARLFVCTCLFLFLTGASQHVVVAQQAETEKSKAEIDAETDRWRGCSLGIRLTTRGEKSFIEKVHDHARKFSALKKDDQLVTVEGVAIAPSQLAELSKLLKSTAPGSTLKVTVIREGEKLVVDAMTFRHEFLDIAMIDDVLRNNRIIKKHLVDTKRPEFMDDFTERLIAAVRSSETPRQAYEQMNRIIDEIDVSHTAFLPSATYNQLLGGEGAEVGLTLQRHTIDGHTGYFVVDIKPGAAFYRQNVLLGDEIVKINGVDVEKSKRLMLAGEEDRHNLFAIRADMDSQIEIQHQTTPFDDVLTSTLKPQQVATTTESFEKSITKLKRDNKSIGYLRFWNLMSLEIATRFRTALRDDFSDCDAVIMDLRGRGGMVHVLLRIDSIVGRYDKPVIAIIDGLTRSAKEMLAYRLKKHENVIVIGTKTAGAVTGATFTALPSGNALMYPALAADSLKEHMDGKILEGIGVGPDEEVNFFIPYCGGNDRMLQTAIKRAAEQATKVR